MLIRQIKMFKDFKQSLSDERVTNSWEKCNILLQKQRTKIISKMLIKEKIWIKLWSIIFGYPSSYLKSRKSVGQEWWSYHYHYHYLARAFYTLRLHTMICYSCCRAFFSLCLRHILEISLIKSYFRNLMLFDEKWSYCN